MTQLVAAIDAGTSGVRSVLFRTDGTVVGMAYEEFASYYPNPSWVEQDASAWWVAAGTTMARALKEAHASANDIVSVSATNQRETIVPIDNAGNPLRRAIVWQDRRTAPQCDWIKAQVPPDEIYSITGLTIDPYFSAPKILWIKEKEPATFRAALKFLLVHDFIIYKLTGRTVTDFSNASRTMLFDLKQASWSGKLLSKFGIPEEKLPDPVASGTRVGEITAEAAKSIHLKQSTPVVAGGGDQQCAALGVGVVRPGSIKTTTGTGTFMLAYSETPKLDPKRRVLCSRHVVPNAYVIEASMFTTGSALRWFRDNLGTEECSVAQKRGVDPYQVITEKASEIPPGSEGVVHIPHLVGAGAPYWNPNARGVFAGLALGHKREHLMRAILEGVCYDIRTNLEVMRELGIAASEVRVTGGAARSEVWMQIQADILGIPVIRTSMEEATALGAAILACKGIGAFSSVADAAEQMVRPLPALQSSSSNRALYDRGFDRYKKLYAALSGFSWDSA